MDVLVRTIPVKAAYLPPVIVDQYLVVKSCVSTGSSKSLCCLPIEKLSAYSHMPGSKLAS
jgi:hypothetical protein